MIHWQQYSHSRAQHRELPASGNHSFLIVLGLWFHFLQRRSVQNLQYSPLLHRYDMSTGLKKSCTVLLPCTVENCTHGEHKKIYEAGQIVVGIVCTCSWNLHLLQPPRSVRFVHGIPRQLNCRTKLPVEQISE